MVGRDALRVVVVAGGGVPGAGEALQLAEDEGQEREQHAIQGAGVRAHLSRLRMERSSEAGEVRGEGGGGVCHLGSLLV
jgi:hypothetical protein